MDKVIFILLVAVIGFYVSLLGYLMLRACGEGYSRSRRYLSPRMEKLSDALRMMRRRAWQRAQWHEKTVLDLQRAACTGTVTPHQHRKALC